MSTSLARTIIRINNLHCQSCVICIQGLIESLDPKATVSGVDISLADRTVSFTHPVNFDLPVLLKQIYAAGFDAEIHSSATAASKPGSSKWTTFFKRKFGKNSADHEAKHKEICLACRMEKGEAPSESPLKTSDLRESTFALNGLTCDPCVPTISNTLSPGNEPGIHSSQVTIIPPSAVVVHDSNILSVDTIKGLVEKSGYGAGSVSSTAIPLPTTSAPTYKVILSIEGMTCSSCTSSVSSAMEGIPGVASITVNLIGKSGSFIVQRKEDAEVVRNEVEDAGFDCAIVDILKQDPLQTNEASKSDIRTVTIRVDGMFCDECIKKVESTLRTFSSLTFTQFSLSNPNITLTYTPSPPDFTIRTIISSISSLNFNVTALSPTSLEDRAALTRLREERRILLLVITALIFAIPTFTVAVVGMSLLKKSNTLRMHLESPVWGNATLGTILLFALASPVQFGVGSFFYAHALKNVKGVWRKRTGNVKTWKVWLQRLFKWGSMDSLVVLGTTVGYVASLALMALDVRTKPTGKMGGEMAWFDSSVFLMLFILCGRYIESLTRHRTSSAITALSSTLPSSGLLLSPSSPSAPPIDTLTPLLEIGDTLLIPVGASPPLDGTLSPSSPPTSFTESSLTGESTPVAKQPSAEDPLYAGTINAGPNAAIMVVSSQPGQTMLDGIVGVVRDAMGRKAGIEKLADVVTGWFVPAVVGVAAFTFAVWCLRGYVGDLPAEWLDSGRGGGWVVFAVQFGVAVLVVACPCGIGLAGPTAQMVGIGLAARHGVLSNGGGEAFQALSGGVDAVIMDKTGTITQGKVCVGENDARIFSSNSEDDTAGIVAMIRTAENASTHPIAVGVREWCDVRMSGFETVTRIPAVELVSSEEIPGRGILATLVYKRPHKGLYHQASDETLMPTTSLAKGTKIELAVGNEKLMRDVRAAYPEGESVEEAERELQGWRMAGKSVVLVSARFLEAFHETGSDFLPRFSSTQHAIIAQLGVHDPPRPEAALLVSELAKLGIDAWMLTGDNEVTARSVAQSVGIESRYVIAGALPSDKQEWVKRLQKGQLKKSSKEDESSSTSESAKRKIVAFIGDGINDAPALAQADVSLAMGSGSRIALSTASFTLLSTRAPLLSFLTIHYIARITRRKILTNFLWACVYNVALIPFAAGAFYEIGGKRTTLPPVWASASMAASSVSVVVNSLALRWRFREPEVVRRWREQESV